MAAHQTEASFHCHAIRLDTTVTLSLPRGLAPLLARLLSGWTLTETNTSADPPDIKVTATDGYALVSSVYQSGRTYDDIISILNELLVAIAYACRASVPSSSLIHAAGFVSGRTAEVVFGARKAGKSVMTARKAAEGCQIFADDLLLWQTKQHRFLGLGLSPRLRRPVLPDILEKLPKDAFIAGKYTCYLDASKIDLAPAGSVLQPDQISELQADQTLRKIGLLQIKNEIMAHCIP